METPQYSTSLVPDNPSPLMQPVAYQGQVYFTSHYFHRQYLANGRYGQSRKYKRHANFLRVIRGIEAYQLYVAQGDIVYWEWEVVSRDKSRLTQDLSYLKKLFEPVGYHPLTLLNATAQLALSHHLDDTVNQELSVMVNRTTAQQTLEASGAAYPERRIPGILQAYLEVGKLLETPAHIVQQEAVKQIEVMTGFDMRPLLLQAPAQQQIADDEVMLEPSDLARVLRVIDGRAVNLLLEKIGWQYRDGDAWESTSVGKPFCVRHAWTHGNKSGYNFKWKVVAVRQALQRARLIS